MPTYFLKVWDEPQEINVIQKSKSVWIASGQYMGKFLSSQGRSPSSAAAHWCAAAKYKGNLGLPEPLPETDHSDQK
jgi:hypothetical protein